MCDRPIKCNGGSKKVKDITMFVCSNCDKFTYVDSQDVEEADYISCAFCGSDYLTKVGEYDLKRE